MSSSKGRTSRPRSPRAERTASTGMVASSSFATTSDRFTALTAAPRRSSATTSLPASWFRKARSADASRTTSFTPSLLAALGNELIGQPASGGNVGAHHGLGAPGGLAGSQDADAAFLQEKDHLIARIQTEGLAILRRNHHSATLAQSCHKPCHMTPRAQSTTRCREWTRRRSSYTLQPTP